MKLIGMFGQRDHLRHYSVPFQFPFQSRFTQSISRFAAFADSAEKQRVKKLSRAEKRRATRDYISKVFDGARDDVRRAVEAAVEYYPVLPAERTALLEAKLWMGERDVRHSLAALIDFSNDDGISKKLLEDSLDNFVRVLTGGSFQAQAGGADVAQARAVSATGGKLRASIATARQRELEAAVDSDLVSRNWRRFANYMKQPLGPVRKKRARKARLPAS